MLITTNGVSNDVTIVDTASKKATKSIKVGRYPWGAAVRPQPTHTSGETSTETR
jgi:YVTN family beta-propeller protein